MGLVFRLWGLAAGVWGGHFFVFIGGSGGLTELLVVRLMVGEGKVKCES